MILDQWIATLLAGDVEDSQQTHIAHLERAKDIWDELRRIHGVSGKGQLSDEIYDLAPEARPSEISRTAVIMNACQGKEYAMAKFTLG